MSNEENNNLDFGFGALPSKFDWRNITLAEAVGEGKTYPPKKILDIAQLPIEYQRKLGACVGHAIQKYAQKLNLTTDKKLFGLSPRFVYAICKCLDGYSGEGTYPKLAMWVAQNYGIATEKTCPNDTTLDHETYCYGRKIENIPKEAIEEAKNYKIGGYSIDTNLTITDIITAVNETDGMAVLALVGPNWYSDKNGTTWDKNRILPIGRPTKIIGGHEIYVYGYEEVQGDYKIYFINSWSKEWGDGGIGWFWWSEYGDLLIEGETAVDLPTKLLEEAKDKQQEFSYRFYKTILHGDQSEDVKNLQIALKLDGCYTYKITGYYGDITASAVAKFQKKYNVWGWWELKPVGSRVGPQTIKKLNSLFAMTLVDKLIRVESGGNDNAIGDKHLVQKAYGCLQIRQPCVDDVNARYGTTHKAEDMLGNRKLSIWVFEKYMSIYATEKRLGRVPTDQDKSRIWNGGPNGYKSDATLAYWKKVEAIKA